MNKMPNAENIILKQQEVEYFLASDLKSTDALERLALEADILG